MFETSPSIARQQWLEQAAEALRVRFAVLGYEMPIKLRFSIGWPKRAATCGSIGECWASASSTDEHIEVFVSPKLGDAAGILDVLAHEFVHAVTPGAGHRGAFKRVALKIGLQGPMRATTAGPDFEAWAHTTIERIGQYPAGAILEPERGGSSKLRKACQCPTCGYTAKVPKKWLEKGAPICPTDNVQMPEIEVAADSDGGEA
jgi:hypothetical protein